MTIQIGNVWELIIVVILFLLAQGGIRYWFSYMGKSGQNTSDKEQIGAITQEVESVKSSFSEGLEKVRTSLLHLSSQTFSISTEERNAIFNFNDSLYKWLSFTRKLSYHDYDTEHSRIVFEKTNELETSFLIADARMELFFFDQEFLRSKTQVYDVVVQLQELLVTCFMECADITHEANLFARSPMYNRGEHLAILSKRIETINRFDELQQQLVERSLSAELKNLRDILNRYIQQVFETDWNKS